MAAPAYQIRRSLYDAVIFDMDGVVTRTAGMHSAAWKKMFDEFLHRRATRKGDRFDPFDIDRDYPRFVDGKPRYDGVRDFLASRGIELPEGHPDDAPGTETVCGLGNLKNSYFRKMLVEVGVERFESTVTFIRQLRDEGIATAVISSSKNCRDILQAAEVEGLFDVRVDGLDALQERFPGKPEPDIFLYAARRLGVQPARAVVVEDAIAGVQAGRRGGFGLVIGVDRTGQTSRLSRFADVVVKDLEEIVMGKKTSPSNTDDLPLALEHIKEMGERLRDKEPVVFIDYDGTLAPIVERPENAIISEEMRQALRDLAAKCSVAIISGRDLQDVKSLVGIEEIVYAGSHGFDISGPMGNMDYQQGLDFLPALDRAEQSLKRLLKGIPGCQVERKRFAIAVHFRRVPEVQVATVESVVEDVLSCHDNLRKTGGKKIFELRPDIEWDKGKAIAWILRELNLDREDVLPFYIGDDLTDEDAFRELRPRGITILVRDEERPTLASYVMDNTEDVRLFLHMLGTFL